MSGNKRFRADVDGIISAGLAMFNKDDTYYSTAVTNLSLYDASSKHGLPASYVQSRTTQIIPNTARSDVGVAYAEIHTKTLPIFQPQVKIGSDPDTLIYEIGLSTQWTGCLINPAVNGTRMQTLLASDSASDSYVNGTGRQTFENNSTVSGFMKDSYGLSIPLALLPSTIKHTLLSSLFDEWRLSTSYLYLQTPFIPVCVGSAYERMLILQPLLDATPSVIGAFIAVKSAEGFKVGDRVRVFGSVDSAAVSTDLNKYTTILSICLYSDLVVAGAIANPTSNDPSVLTLPCLVVDNTSTTGLNLASTVRRSNGYVVNCMTDNRGGRIQLLTDEFEFKPLTITPTACTANSLTANLPASVGVTAGKGFLRTGALNWNVMVEVQATTEPKLNGLYRVSSSSGTSSIVLTPISHVLDGSFSGTATLRLAPNAYNFLTNVNNSLDPGYALFNQLIGLPASETDDLLPPSYPPIATTFVNSWKRAYTPTFKLSAYRNLQWVTQDIATRASPPTYQQDFGDSSSSTYYNVYNMQTFINECVNPAYEKCLSEDTGVVPTNYEEYSLQKQLSTISSAYQQTFQSSNDSFAYDPAVTYAAGSTVIYRGRVYIAYKLTTKISPGSGDSSWLLLGDAKNETYSVTGNLLFTTATGGGYSFSCVGTSMLNEKVILSRIPTFKTAPPRFDYNALERLFFFTADTYSFGNLYPFIDTKQFDGTYTTDPRNFNYKSWGYKNACSGVDTQGAQEQFIMESNSPFKFLMDNFQCSAIEYINPVTNDTLAYWLWPCYGDPKELWYVFNRKFTQESESLSSCACPVQSIVITSRTIPVLPSLGSPTTIISDFNTASSATANTVSGDSDNIIGEFSVIPGSLLGVRSVLRYQPDQVTFYSLQSTLVFKQLDYAVFYRHRVTQKLVPLILSNYGNVNIKFVFKPT